MKARTIPELLRDLSAEAKAKRYYSDRCGELFQLSDISKAEGHPLSARLYHDAAVIIGHAAWAEEVDPDE